MSPFNNTGYWKLVQIQQRIITHYVIMWLPDRSFYLQRDMML